MWTLVLHIWFAGTLGTASYAHDFANVEDCVQARSVIIELANKGRASKSIEFGRCAFEAVPAQDDTDVEPPTHNFLKEA